MNENSSLRRGIFTIFTANILNIAFKLFIKFVQPMFFSMETYSQIQSFTLYMTYASTLHCGFIDGMYLKYGGKKLLGNDIGNIKRNLANLRGILVIITLIVIIPVSVSGDKVLGFCLISLIPANVIVYYQMLYQAVGEFNKYGRILNINTILLFVGTFVCIFIFGADSFVIYLEIECIVYIFLALILEYDFKKSFSYSSRNFPILFDKAEIFSYIKIGIPLTIGGISSTLFLSLDRWFVKFLMSSVNFAIYSFAISLESFLNIAVNPIIITLYNHLCNHRGIYEVQKLKNMILIFASFIVSAAFPACFIIKYFMTAYLNAADVIYVLFSAKIVCIVIRGVYDNLYKAERRQNLYLKRLIMCIVVGFITNYIAYIIYPNIISFSLATLITMFVWLFICACDFRSIKWNFNEIIFLVYSSISMIIIGYYFDPLIGFFLYVVSIIVASYVFMKNSFIGFVKILISR